MTLIVWHSGILFRRENTFIQRVQRLQKFATLCPGRMCSMLEELSHHTWAYWFNSAPMTLQILWAVGQTLKSVRWSQLCLRYVRHEIECELFDPPKSFLLIMQNSGVSLCQHWVGSAAINDFWRGIFLATASVVQVTQVSEASLYFKKYYTHNERTACGIKRVVSKCIQRGP